MSRKKPAALGIADGTHRRDRHGPRTIPDADRKTLAELPEPPDGLGEEGRRRWSALGAALLGQGLLTPVDLFSLEHLCKFYDQQRDLEQLLKKEESATTRRMLAKVYEEIRRMLDALGCSPTARPGLPATPTTTNRVGPRKRDA